MYVVVGVSAGFLKLWQFKIPITPMLEGVVPQVGFFYGRIIVEAIAII